MSPSPAAIASELERIAVSRGFSKAERCLRLLRYVTECALAGRGSELKEYTLAVEVFERPQSFDPRVDPVVRLEVRRLRLKLAEYYQHEGAADAVVIELPKGAYVPYFRSREERQSAPVIPARRQPPYRLWAPVAAGAVALALGAWYLLPRHPRPAMRTSVAVLGFRDNSATSETSWIDAAVAELMDSELGAGEQLRTLPAENVARVRRELSIAPQTSYPAPTLQRIGTNLGSDYAVAGAYRLLDGRVHLDVVLFDLRSGRQIAAIGEEASAGEIANLAQNCARRLRAQLGVRLTSVPGGMAIPPVEPAAIEAYARGMERLRQWDALGARPYLERAALVAPSNPLIHSGLAVAWSMMGLDNRALAEARLAFDSSSALPRVQQLEIEGRYREIAHDWPRAIQVYQALVTLLPDDLEYGLRLMNAETGGGKAQDALALVSTLRKLPPPVGDDPRIDFAEAQTAGALSDFDHTRRAAHAAAEKARKQGARLQYARARLLESGAMQNLGIAGSQDARAEARNLCTELGDRACVAAALRIEANYQAIGGAPAKAQPLYAAVLEIANQMGNQLEKLNALMGMAYTEQLRGDLKAAEADYREALAVGTEIGPMKRYSVLVDLSDVLASEGRIAESQALSSEALEAASQAHDTESVGYALAAQAHALVLAGKFPEAIAAYNQAIASYRTVQEPFQTATVILARGDAQLQQGDTVAAQKSYQEASELDWPHKEAFKPDLDTAFARLSLAAGLNEQAASRARAAMSAYAAGGREADRLEAAALLARALVAVGDDAGASAVLDGIPSPEGRPFPVEAVVQFRLARCLVAAHAGHRAKAGRDMDAIAAEVSRLGLPALEKETRMAREALMRTR